MFRPKGETHKRISKKFGFASIAQLVEQRTENPRVTGSIPVRGTFLSVRISYGFFYSF